MTICLFLHSDLPPLHLNLIPNIQYLTLALCNVLSATLFFAPQITPDYPPENLLFCQHGIQVFQLHKPTLNLRHFSCILLFSLHVTSSLIFGSTVLQIRPVIQASIQHSEQHLSQ